MITDDEKDSEDRIWCGKDKYGNEIWKTEEELEQEAVKLQKWQRDKFARELGLNIPSMAFIYCKKCGEYRYLTPHAFWNVNDLGVKCKNCGTINTITLENGELRKQS